MFGTRTQIGLHVDRGINEGRNPGMTGEFEGKVVVERIAINFWDYQVVDVDKGDEAS